MRDDVRCRIDARRVKIAAARMIGATTTIDRDETLQWAAATVAKAENLL